MTTSHKTKWREARIRVSSQEHCLWIPVGDFDENVWASQCGNEFVLEEGTPVTNGFKFCVWCGKTLKEEMT